MIGFKTSQELNLQECQNLLHTTVYQNNEELNYRLKELLRHENLEQERINNITLEEYSVLIENKSHPDVIRIKSNYAHHLGRWQKEEKEAYTNCKTLEDYNQFLSMYGKYSSFYKMLYEQYALQKIEDINWDRWRDSVYGCECYLSQFPAGRYVTNAQKIIKEGNRERNIIMLIVILLIIFVFIFAVSVHGS